MDIVKTNSESSDSEYRWTTSEDSANSNSYNNDKALCLVSYDGGHLYESEVTSQQFHEGVIGDPLNDKGKRILLSSSQSNEYTSYWNAKRFNGGPSINEDKETSKAKPNSGSEADQDDGYIRKSNVVKAKSHPSGNRKNVDDGGNNVSVRDQSLVEYDERVVYEEALQNLDGRKYIADLPQGVLTVSLLLHQKVALAWMVQKEKSRHCSGGFLADDQGLGKTISMISLILKQKTLQLEFKSSNSKPTCHLAYNLDDEEEYDNIMTTTASSNWKPAAGTLIVCPATVLRQWARELAEKVNRRHKLSVLIYHGGTRTRDPYQLTKYDVVLTTYALVTNEVPKVPSAFEADIARKKKNEGEVKLEFSDKKSSNMPSVQNKGKKKLKRAKDSSSNSESGPLGRVRWFRVILDEAQTIKNHRTKVARACCGLRAKNRWCLSGTPVQNSIDDLYSYFRFLKYEPYACYSSFCNLIKAPISQDSCSGYTKLQTVLNIVLLRRTKETLIDGMPIVQLPPKKIFLKKVEFSPEERTFYKKLEAESRQLFKRYAAAGTVKKNYASILLMLLRMRQACNHPILVKGYHSENVGKGSLEIAKQLPEERLLELIHQLEGSLAICVLCNDPPENAVVTICGHVFCYQCVSERLTGDDNMCPASGCKETLNTDVTFSRSTLQKCITDQNDNDKASSSASTNNEDPSIFQSGYVSSKVKAALGILNTLCSPDYVVGSKEWNEWDHTIPIKAIVFSQWNGMLDLVEDSLNQNLIQYRRLDGSMSLASRDKAVMEFNSDPEVTVMLMSLKAGNLGLNMVAASHVILLDLWWNPATEDQAIDRAHRIGQTRPVNVSRLTIKDTIEDRILSLQDEKRSLVSSAIGEDIGNHARKLTMEDLKYLFMI